MSSHWEAEQCRCDGNTEFQERNWVGRQAGLGTQFELGGGGWAVGGVGGKQARSGAEQVTVGVRRRLRDVNVDSAT